MTTLPSSLQARAAVDVPWDRARERRVLDGALDSWQRRVRRQRTFALSAAVVTVLLIGRVLPHLSASGDETRPGPAVPAAQLAPGTENDPAISLSDGAAPRTSSGSTGGFAGTGGHGGTGSTGLGGSAGTG